MKTSNQMNIQTDDLNRWFFEEIKVVSKCMENVPHS